MSTFINQTLIDALGWTLIHSLWQGAVIALLATILLVVMRRSAPRIRYIVMAGLLLMLPVASLVTFFQVYQPFSEAIVEETASASNLITSFMLLPAQDQEAVGTTLGNFLHLHW